MFFLPAAFLTAIAIFCALYPLSQRVTADGSIPAEGKRRRVTALSALLFIPLFAIGLYSALGRPDLPDMPLSERRNASLDEADFSTLISRLEQNLQRNKNDVRGWMLLARSYRDAERLDESAHAYRKAASLEKSNISALLGLAEVLCEKEDRVTDEAKVIFQQVLHKDKANPEARFFLAKAKIESGDTAAGLRDMKTLLVGAPEGAPWRSWVEKEIERHE